MPNHIRSAPPLPPLVAPEEARKLLSAQLYGCLPDPPDQLRLTENGKRALGKEGIIRSYTLTLSLGGRQASFPFFYTYPQAGRNGQVILHMNFRPDIPDRYMPAETICGRGFSLLSYGYQDVTRDDGDFTHGVAGLFFPRGERKANDPGKLMLWAWAAMRVLDAAEQIPDIPTDYVTIAGHSRLGKAALLAGGYDPRFWSVCSNESGRCGAALHRRHRGETLSHMRRQFPFWFCPHFLTEDWEEPPNLDQHQLLALTAPRRLYIASAAEDAWADPENEFRSLTAAAEAWPDGKKESFFGGRLPKTGDVFHGRQLACHLRPGAHAFTKADWTHLMDALARWAK